MFSLLCHTGLMPLFTCRVVLFDLDGVLVDSTPCVARVWTNWAKEHGLNPEYVVHLAHGQKAIETIRRVARTSIPRTR